MPYQAPRTSFIVPARNAASTLAKALDSLLAQHDIDWEALVVDDASSDATAAVLATYSARDPRIIALRGSGTQGASGARNVGLQRARGRWLVFLDSDDWIASNFLDRMHRAREATGASVIYCDYCRVMPDGTHASPSTNPEVAQAPFLAFAGSCPVAIHAVLLERERVVRVGGFDTSLRTCEDWDLWQRVTREGGRWERLPEALVFYRSSDNSLSQDPQQLMVDSEVVIARAYTVDPRVPLPDPAHVAGVPADGHPTFDQAIAYLALWCYVLGPDEAPDPSEIRRKLSALPRDAEHAHWIAVTIVDSLLARLRLEPKQLVAQWAEYGPRVSASIDALGAMWGDPVAARRVQYAFERAILECDDLAAPRALKLTLGCRIDLRDPPTLAVPPGIDRLYGRLCYGPRMIDAVHPGALGTVGPRQWIELAARHLSWKWVGVLAASAGARALVAGRARQAAKALRPWLRRSSVRALGARTVVRAAGRDLLLAAAPPASGPSGHQLALAALQCEAADAADAARYIASIPAPSGSHTGEGADPHEQAADSRRAYWERLFSTPDPWNYGSAYEQEKYAFQLELLPPGLYDTVLELACAEGRFTEQLAPRTRRLIAADISATALARAAARCRGHGHIEFRQLDLATEALPQGVDAIFCSEVLYYLSNAELQRVACKIAEALKPGGRFIHAHAMVLGDDRTRTGFDWGHPWGALTISRTFAEVLALERSLRTELYVVDAFVRRGECETAARAQVEARPMRAELEIEVERYLVRGGAVSLRSEVAGQRSMRLPVLAYHRVAEDGPAALACYRVAPAAFEAQMRWLRRHGYHAIVADDLVPFLERGQPLSGRPVLITFDDGYEDFAEAAWPVLRRHDFTADVFVVTDLVGGRAEWDRRYGERAPLMDAATIGALARQGVRFGSHLATHRDAGGLSTRELAHELVRSRVAIERWTGNAPCALAAPFGLNDERLQRLARECGYSVGFGTQEGIVALCTEPMALPRIEVRGDMAIDEFAAVLEAAR
jgi:peptidoglycan/xylan/chitin deacetylase (PgdA/CDA1 family)/SAM-dependent methyltransferase